MIRAFFSVGFFTLISRFTGFLRDLLLAQTLGAGMAMDAFAIAFRLPNHFRAIFAEGAFNTAFLPCYTRIRTKSGAKAADFFLGEMLSLVLLSQFLLLGIVLLNTPGFVAILAPGFNEKPATLALASELMRLTFPYLGLVTIVVLWTGVLNAERRFAVGAGASILLNISMLGTLALSILFRDLFSSPAHAAAIGVLIAGFLEFFLLAGATIKAKLFALPRLPRLDEETRGFFRAFWPAIIGSAGVQLAMLADTLLVTYLPQGGASSLYYADRLYQLPLGVIGAATGTVLLPEMSRLLSQGKENEAQAQHEKHQHQYQEQQV